MTTEAPETLKPARPQWQFKRSKNEFRFDPSPMILDKNGRRKCWDGKGKPHEAQGFIIPSHL